MKSASTQRKLPSLISKGFIITVLKCKVPTMRQAESGLDTRSLCPESSQQKCTGSGSCSSVSFRHLRWEIIPTSLMGARTSGLGAVRHVPKEAEQYRGLQIRKSWKTHCSNSASHLPLKLERPGKVRAVSSTVKWRLRSSAREHGSAHLTRAISNKDRAVKIGQ